jgi:hypothetical protein
MVVGTLTDRFAVDRATAGMEMLIHLAATPDDDDFLERIVPNNIIGVYHVMESAQQAGVTRLILASSGQVTWYDRMRGGPVTPATPPSPRYWYACGKVFLEAAGRSFAEKFGLSVLAVRLGWCPRTKEQEAEIRAEPWAQDVYLSPGDAGRFFACAVEASGPDGFAVVYATSKPVHRTMCDLEPTRTLVGYEPLEQWPMGLQ